ncbi:MAG: response regulator [Candidatus Thermoplasmatota archaeon]
MTRILLVDPNKAESDQLNASLTQRENWHVTRVGSIIEAIREAGENSFDAAILDYDLPDGSGLDILDFLRIGSPGIRIVVLGDQKSEEVAFHALSHGAGDYIVKDKHLDVELPRRMGVLLENTSPEYALVETLMPHAYDTASSIGAPPQEKESAVNACLRELVNGSIIAAGVFDHHGRPIAARLMPDIDADGLGFALATIHGQIGAVWTYGNIKPIGYTMIVDVDGGLLGITAIPGTFLVAMLFETPISRHRALEKLEAGAARITQAMQA